MKSLSSRGFTLIELMIAVAIIAIIAAVAFPSYQESVQKTRRADAKAALEAAAAMQERHFTENNTYSESVNDLGGTGGVLQSSERFYNITVVGGCKSGAYVGCFDLTATATGVQLKDTDCKTFTLDETGTRAAKNSGGTINSNCW